MLYRFLRDLVVLLVEARAQLQFATAARCAPALAVVLAVGFLTQQTQAAAIAAGGAMVVGFGAFQQVTRSPIGPMLFAVLGTGSSTLVGTLAGGTGWGIAAAAFVWGFCCGMLPVIGAGPFWVGQQCTVFMLIAEAYPGDLDYGLTRTALVLGGGVVQIALYWAFLSFTGKIVSPHPKTLLGGAAAAMRAVVAHLTWRSPFFEFALRMAVILVVAVETERFLDIPNGYWVGMTTLLLMRQDFHDTLSRSWGRIAGTLAGAGLATFIYFAFHPEPALLAALVVMFAFLSYGLLRTHYGVLSLCLTAYVIFLLALAGLVEETVAKDRILATILGGAFAVAAHLNFNHRRHRDAAALRAAR